MWKGVLCRIVIEKEGTYYQIILPKNLQYKKFTTLHKTDNHQGFERTLSLIWEYCHWVITRDDKISIKICEHFLL